MQARIHIRRTAKPGLSRLGRRPPNAVDNFRGAAGGAQHALRAMPEAGEAPSIPSPRGSRARLLMTTPGVDTMVSLTYASVIDDPHRFRSSKAVLRENSCRADQSD